MIWCGNLLGTFLVAQGVRHSRSFPAVSARIAKVCAAKAADCWPSWLILSFFCGILMYTAVEGFKRKEELPGVVRMTLVFLCVAVFILSGFEHCIADMFYFSAAGAWNADSLKTILIITAGNSLGGFLLPAAELVRHDS